MRSTWTSAILLLPALAALSGCGPTPCKEGECPDVSGTWSATLTQSEGLNFCPLFVGSSDLALALKQPTARGPTANVQISGLALAGGLYEGNRLIATAQNKISGSGVSIEQKDRLEVVFTGSAPDAFDGSWTRDTTSSGSGASFSCTGKASVNGLRRRL